jgi:hypothetical protein
MGNGEWGMGNGEWGMGNGVSYGEQLMLPVLRMIYSNGSEKILFLSVSMSTRHEYESKNR